MTIDDAAFEVSVPIMLKMRKLYCDILKPKKCDKEKLSPP